MLLDYLVIHCHSLLFNHKIIHFILKSMILISRIFIQFHNISLLYSIIIYYSYSKDIFQMNCVDDFSITQSLLNNSSFTLMVECFNCNV